ncbi:anterior fat body protein [Penicillium macrosclerotiorum]|uniref:anterior fat body protein n=1 Tax=Penicillium macrosclerotiorum TaxID=303699 RepID=UPI002549127A|nr:anterior fat body protein [Penicillium macrosclerotiorum]KAJ5679943.1 anterior fat body protein [Penicillium macrosclerotiorum]
MDGLESIDGGRKWYSCPEPMVLGEAPIFRASDSTLHWVDCLSDPSRLYVLKVDEHGDAIGEARVLELEDSVTVVFFRKGRPGYIAAYYQGICFIDEQTGKMEVVEEIIPTHQREELRFNDGGIDAQGRFWLAEIDKKAMAFGPNQLPSSYGVPKGRLWRYDLRAGLRLMIADGIICGNGLGWSPDNKTMYFHDSVAMVVWAYDFDLEHGNISNKRLLIDRRTSFGEPDGMVVDTKGNLWIAMFDSNRVMVFTPDGRHLKDIVFSARNPACTTWGGKDFNIIYVATGKDRRANPAPGDEGGHLFRYKPTDARGQPKHEFDG